MLKELLDKQKLYTEYFFQNLDLEPIEKLMQYLSSCKGMIFLSGIGKSGIVAKKIAYTMVSTGTRAFYLTPIDALHGDLGMVTSEDVFIILSKSGESDELLNLIPAIKNKGAHLVGLVCNPSSKLAAACDSLIVLPFMRELCPFDMAPTISTTAQSLFGDLLTIALMKQKNFTLNEYALNHPSGRIGKRITLKVKDLMLKDDKVPLCHPDDFLKDVLVTLSNKRCGCILIVDEQKKLLGIFTDGDLRRTLQEIGGDFLSIPIKELMYTHPKTIDSNALAWDAMKMMEADPKKRITVLPVINDERIVQGLIHIHDIVQSGL